MFFADRHEHSRTVDQFRTIKKSYRESFGNEIQIKLEFYKSIDSYYYGQSTIFTHGASLNREFSFGAELLEVNSNILEVFGKPQMVIQADNAVICLPKGGYNIHHFIVEILPSIYLYRVEISEIGVLVLGGFETSTFIDELLGQLLPNVEIIKVPPKTKVKSENSFLLSSFPYKIYPIELLNEIREYFRLIFLEESRSSAQSPGNLFYSRGDRERNRRVLDNQDLFLAEVTRLGKMITVTYPALQEVRKSIGVSMNSTCQLSQSGGGFIHMLWAETQSQIIELKPIEFVGNTEIYDLCRLLGMNYQAFETSTLGTDWRNNPQSLSIEHISRIIELLD